MALLGLMCMAHEVLMLLLHASLYFHIVKSLYHMTSDQDYP